MHLGQSVGYGNSCWILRFVESWFNPPQMTVQRLLFPRAWKLRNQE